MFPRSLISITHEHLLSVVHAELGKISTQSTIRLLDAGCGSGQLIAYLAESLPPLHPACSIEIYGYDVSNHGVQSQGFFDEAVNFLAERHPHIKWQERLKLIHLNDAWPFPSEFFDIIISNQVLEHINNHDLFFAELHRTLKSGGTSAHLFPLQHYFFEGHLHLPFVHWIMNHDVLVGYIKLLSWMGLGKYNSESDDTLDNYSIRHADYMHYYTNYLSYSNTLQLAKRYNLRATFRYTQEFYIRKLRSLLGLKPSWEYPQRRSAIVDWLSVNTLKYISSITLFIEKSERYSSQ